MRRVAELDEITRTLKKGAIGGAWKRFSVEVGRLSSFTFEGMLLAAIKQRFSLDTSSRGYYYLMLFDSIHVSVHAVG